MNRPAGRRPVGPGMLRGFRCGNAPLPPASVAQTANIAINCCPVGGAPKASFATGQPCAYGHVWESAALPDLVELIDVVSRAVRRAISGSVFS